MSQYLELVTECEHGQTKPHRVTFVGEWPNCPGGSRKRVEPDYEAGANVMNELLSILRDGQEFYPAAAQAVIGIALGLGESDQ